MAIPSQEVSAERALVSWSEGEPNEDAAAGASYRDERDAPHPADRAGGLQVVSRSNPAPLSLRE